jgi:hypothetical protein
MNKAPGVESTKPLVLSLSKDSGDEEKHPLSLSLVSDWSGLPPEEAILPGLVGMTDDCIKLNPSQSPFALGEITELFCPVYRCPRLKIRRVLPLWKRGIKGDLLRLSRLFADCSLEALTSNLHPPPYVKRGRTTNGRPL